MTDPKDRIILALDVDEAQKAITYVEKFAEHVGGFKIGLELTFSTYVRMMTHDERYAFEELRTMRKLFALIGEKLFWDVKLKDIPNTVNGAARPISGMGIQMFNVHADGGPKMMREVIKTAESMAKVSPNGKRPRVLAVTVLTSIDDEDLAEMEEWPVRQHGEPDKHMVADRVVHLAMLAEKNTIDGVVCSPAEVQGIRKLCGPDFLIVAPNTKPAWATWTKSNDQSGARALTPTEAIAAGADALVIGRAITGAPDPFDAISRVIDEIKEGLTKSMRTASW